MIISFIYQFIWTNKIAYCRNMGLSCEVDDTRLSPFYHDHDRAAMIGNIGKEWSAQCNLGADSIKIYHLTSIGNPIVEIRRSYDRLISTMGFPILVRWHLYIEGRCGASGYLRYLVWLILTLSYHSNEPLIRYVKLRVAHGPGKPGTFSPVAYFKWNR